MGVATGISARGGVVVGTGTVTQCTVLFPSQRIFAAAPVCTLTSTDTTPYTGTVSISSTIAGLNFYGSSNMQGKAFQWQCDPL
jgi:hypothetical protein